MNSRRTFVSALGLLGAGAAIAPLGQSMRLVSEAFAETDLPATKLKPGEFLWYPERAPKGPVAVVVSLSDQLAFVYRNGIRIGVTTVSSGRKGYDTPTGVFTVLRKEKMHHSSKYNNAAMPDSQFFFGGCALHAGGLPGYPSSHGCVHLPLKFADLLFPITHNGTPVIVTNARSGTGALTHSGLVMSQHDLQEIEHLTGNIKAKGLPTDSGGANPDVFSILVSGADKKLYAIKNGKLAFTANVGIDQPRWPLGSHVFVLHGYNAANNHYDWFAVGLGSGADHVDQQKEIAVTTRLTIPQDAFRKIAENLHPGSTYMLTDLPAHPDTRTGADFVIMRNS